MAQDLPYKQGKLEETIDYQQQITIQNFINFEKER